jgi:hypothetical protein
VLRVGQSTQEYVDATSNVSPSSLVLFDVARPTAKRCLATIIRSKSHLIIFITAGK